MLKKSEKIKKIKQSEKSEKIIEKKSIILVYMYTYKTYRQYLIKVARKKIDRRQKSTFKALAYAS